MSKKFKQYIKSGREALHHLENYKAVAERVKEIVKTKYHNARVYVFGSTLEGRYTASSDIDILVVDDTIRGDDAAALKAKILMAFNLSAPLQIHIAAEKEFKEWYSKFIRKIQEVT